MPFPKLLMTRESSRFKLYILFSVQRNHLVMGTMSKRHIQKEAMHLKETL